MAIIRQTEDRARFRRIKTEQAIQLAIENRWEDAYSTNKAILEVFPDDIDAYNRLGKALTELGRYPEAREAYTKALRSDPTNTIARRNLDRLAMLVEQAGSTRRAEAGPKANPTLFISETGKSGPASLIDIPADVLLRASVGDEIFLRQNGATLKAETVNGEYLGSVEPRLGLRLSKLLEGGNEYTAAITHLSTSDVRILIKETYQHPSQSGKLSFPPTGADEGFRPYIKESVLKRETGDDLVVDEEEVEDWEDGSLSKEAEERIYAERTSDIGDEDAEANGNGEEEDFENL